MVTSRSWTIEQRVQLLDNLTARGIDLPEPVLSARTKYRALEAITQPPAAKPDPRTASATQLVTYCRRFVEVVAVADHLKGQATGFYGDLASQMVEEMREGLDLVLDQLRPEFDETVGKITEAMAAGIKQGNGPHEVVMMSPAALIAYQSLGPAARKLNALADVRIRIAEMLDEFGHIFTSGGVPPVAACFCTAPSPWLLLVPSQSQVGGLVRSTEDSVDRWMRLTLAQGSPLRLMTAAETQKNAQKHRLVPRASMVEDADGRMQMNLAWGDDNE